MAQISSRTSPTRRHWPRARRPPASGRVVLPVSGRVVLAHAAQRPPRRVPLDEGRGRGSLRLPLGLRRRGGLTRLLLGGVPRVRRGHGGPVEDVQGILEASYLCFPAPFRFLVGLDRLITLL